MGRVGVAWLASEGHPVGLLWEVNGHEHSHTGNDEEDSGDQPDNGLRLLLADLCRERPSSRSGADVPRTRALK
jgi:hypothetical protein